MKFLTLLAAMFLVACDGHGNAESHNIHLGDTKTVQRGFYKGCRGYVTDYDDYNSIPDRVTLRDVTCPKATATIIITNAEDLDEN